MALGYPLNYRALGAAKVLLGGQEGSGPPGAILFGHTFQWLTWLVHRGTKAEPRLGSNPGHRLGSTIHPKALTGLPLKMHGQTFGLAQDGIPQPIHSKHL